MRLMKHFRVTCRTLCAASLFVFVSTIGFFWFLHAMDVRDPAQPDQPEVFISKVPSWPRPECKLPVGAAWAIAKPESGEPFNMAVKAPDAQLSDDMSHIIRTRGYYELSGPMNFPGLSSSNRRNTAQLNVGVFFDAGANIGDWAFFMATAGWRVVAVEGSPDNVALMNATLCDNPVLRDRVRVVHALVGSAENDGQICTICGRNNVDGGEHAGTQGQVICGKTASTERLCAPGVPELKVESKSLKSILQVAAVANVDAFKMDIEGFECTALAGYPELAKRHSLTWVLIETADDKTRKCVKQWSDSNGYKIAQPWNNEAIMTRNRPWILRELGNINWNLQNAKT